jgi:flagella basal body P-ring formation protein FlgA
MQRLCIFIFGMLLFPLLLEAQGKPVQTRDAEIRAAVETYVRQKTAGLGYEIRIKRLSVSSGAIALPEGSLEYEIVAPQQWEGWGSTSLAVIVRQDERVLRNIAGRVEVEALAEMAVAARQIDHGTVISAGDVALKKLDVSGTQGHYLGTVADVAGKKTRSSIRANAPFRPEQLEKVALIKSGQIVTIVAENERIRVTLTGKAKSAGAEGDMINVQNLNSLKEFPARVVDAATVMVAF